MDYRIGDEVLAPWLDDGFLYPAVLVALEGDQAHVAYLDGDEADVAATSLQQSAFSPGVRLQVNWKGRKTYFWGTIERRVGMAIFMNYEDGSKEWATISLCRVPAALATSRPATEVSCNFCGEKISTTVKNCPNCGGPRASVDLKN
jgi:hypothetical protein